jgi:hypothetical protein
MLCFTTTSNEKNVLGADVLSQNPLIIKFVRAHSITKWATWIHLVRRLKDFQISNGRDVFILKLTTSGVFTVKSLYLNHISGHTPFLRKYIWNIKFPLKIRIFIWFLHQNVILTKDNLAKRKLDRSHDFFNHSSNKHDNFFSENGCLVSR